MRQYCQELIEHRGIYRCPPGEKLPGKHPGMTYTWQFYLRRCLYDAKFAYCVGRLFWEKFQGEVGTFQLGACEDAGVPVATAIQSVAFCVLGKQVPIISFKKQPKAYGLLNLTEGPVDLSLPVLLVDDIAASRLTLDLNRGKAENRGFVIYPKYFTVVDKMSTVPTAEERVYRKSQLQQQELVALFNLDDFHLRWTDYVAAYQRDPEFGPVV